jgi:hypothetical protein
MAKEKKSDKPDKPRASSPTDRIVELEEQLALAESVNSGLESHIIVLNEQLDNTESKPDNAYILTVGGVPNGQLAVDETVAQSFALIKSHNGYTKVGGIVS